MNWKQLNSVRTAAAVEKKSTVCATVTADNQNPRRALIKVLREKIRNNEYHPSSREIASALINAGKRFLN